MGLETLKKNRLSELSSSEKSKLDVDLTAWLRHNGQGAVLFPKHYNLIVQTQHNHYFRVPPSVYRKGYENKPWYVAAAGCGLTIALAKDQRVKKIRAGGAPISGVTPTQISSINDLEEALNSTEPNYPIGSRFIDFLGPAMAILGVAGALGVKLPFTTEDLTDTGLRQAAGTAAGGAGLGSLLKLGDLNLKGKFEHEVKLEPKTEKQLTKTTETLEELKKYLPYVAVGAAALLFIILVKD